MQQGLTHAVLAAWLSDLFLGLPWLQGARILLHRALLLWVLWAEG